MTRPPMAHRMPHAHRRPGRRALVRMMDAPDSWKQDVMATERDAVRVELVTLRNLLTYAFGTDGWHIALNVRDRLTSLCARLERRGTA